MARNIYSFIPYTYSPHLETDLELLHDHVQQGDTVTVFVCNGELTTCEPNPDHDLIQCQQCINKRRNGLDQLGLTNAVQLKPFVNLTDNDRQVLSQYTHIIIDSIQHLRQLTLENTPIGEAVFATWVAILTEAEPDVIEHQAYLQRAIYSAVLVYLSFKQHFLESRPDLFMVFNGRFTIARPARDAAWQLNIPFVCHERAGVMNRYTLVPNVHLLDLPYWKKEMQRFWDDSALPLNEKQRLGREWYDSRREHKSLEWYSYTQAQTQDLPTGFDVNKKNVVLFNSSLHEFVAEPDYNLPFYETQEHGIWRIADDLKDEENIQLYLRIHPSLKDKQNSQTAFLKKIQQAFPSLHVIPSDSPVKTYNLIDAADLVVTFTSTVGIEAAYANRHSVLLGPATYEDLAVSTRFESHAAFIAFVKASHFELPQPIVEQRQYNALIYAFFHATRGVPFKVFEQVGIFYVLLNGQPLSLDTPEINHCLKKEALTYLDTLPKLDTGALLMQQLLHQVDSLNAKIATMKQNYSDMLASKQREKSFMHLKTKLGKKIRLEIQIKPLAPTKN
jgi:hypothetical protein